MVSILVIFDFLLSIVRLSPKKYLKNRVLKLLKFLQIDSQASTGTNDLGLYMSLYLSTNSQYSVSIASHNFVGSKRK